MCILPLDNDDGTCNCNLYFLRVKVGANYSGNKAMRTHIALMFVYRFTLVSKAVNSLRF